MPIHWPEHCTVFTHDEWVLVSNLLLNLSPFSATHGSGVGLMNMAAMVTKLELINGEGKILTLTPQNNKDFFNAAQVFMLFVDVFRVMGARGERRRRELKRARSERKRERERKGDSE